MIKKIIYIAALCSYTLLPQLGNISFVEYMERMQYDDPEKSIRWFRANGYTPEYGVNELVFDFYRGISRYLSYVSYQGAKSELNKAASDFRHSMELPQDSSYYYKDRSILYIGGILTILYTDKEVPARIFEYFVNTSGPSNPYYSTALYWSAYLKYLTPQAYESYYNTLVQLSKDYRNTVYDYLTGKMRPISEMIKKLDTPDKMKPNNYTWTNPNMDIFTLIRNSVPLVSEDSGLKQTSAQKFALTPNYPPTKTAYQTQTPLTNTAYTQTPVIVKTNTQTSQPIIATNKVQTNQIIENITETINENITIEEPPYIPPAKKIETPVYTPPKTNNIEAPIIKPIMSQNMLTVVINKNPANGPLRVDIGGHLINTVTSTNFKTIIAPGTYQAIITFARNIYTNTVTVEPAKDNIFTIIVEDVRTKSKEYLINASGVNQTNFSSSLNVSQGEKTRNTIRNVLTQPAYIATEWFNTNPYRESMGISTEEYTYYRGVAYYARFVTDGRTSPVYAAQAKSDLTYAYNKQDNPDLLMRTELYLAALDLFAYNNLYDADKRFAKVQSTLSKGDRYYPTVLYWRVRLGALNSEERAAYIRILNTMSKNTPILDYTTTKFETISTMPSYLNKIGGIIPVANVTPLFLPPRESVSGGKSYSSLNNPNVTLYISDISNERYQINILSRGINTILPYRGLIYSGMNSMIISSASKSIPFKIQANENEAYSILFLILG